MTKIRKIVRNRYFRAIGLSLLLSTGYWLLATPAASAQSISDRIQRGCGALGGDFVRVLTDFDGSVRIKVCTGGSVFFCTSAGVCTAVGTGNIGGAGTVGTIPRWTGAATLGDSFATQTATSFAITPPLGGAFIAGRTGGGRPNFTISDTSQLISARINLTNYFAVDGANDQAFIGRATGNAAGMFDTANGVTRVGDAFAVGGGTRVEIDDANSTIKSFAFGSIEFGDLAGGANGLTFKLNDSTQTIIAEIGGGVQYFNLNGATGTATIGNNGSNALGLFNGTLGTSTIGDTGGQVNGLTFVANDTAQTFTLNNANYFNCLTLGTDAAGVITCTVSDVGLKNNLAPFTRGLWAINQLKPSYWTFNEGRYYHGGDRFAGLLAQDVEKVIPEAVSRTGNGHLQINPATMQATLVNAVKELSIQIEELRAEIAALKSNRPIRRPRARSQ